MGGDMQCIMNRYTRGSKEAAAPAPAPPLRVMEIHLTPEQRSALSAQWQQSGAAATELVLTACDGKIGSLRISCGWISEPS